MRLGRLSICLTVIFGSTCWVVADPLEFVPACPPAWHLDEVSDRCIKAFDNMKMGWNEARDFCDRDGADLVVIRDQEKNEFVTKLLLEKKRYWIGHRYRHDTQEFRILDGQYEKTPYHPWAAKEPNNHLGREECVEIIGNGRGSWNDKRCSRRRFFVCEKLPLQVPIFEGPPEVTPPPRGLEEPISCDFETECNAFRYNAKLIQDEDYTFQNKSGHLLIGYENLTVEFDIPGNQPVCLSFWVRASGPVVLGIQGYDKEGHPDLQYEGRLKHSLYFLFYVSTVTTANKKGSIVVLSGTDMIELDDFELAPGACPQQLLWDNAYDY